MELVKNQEVDILIGIGGTRIDGYSSIKVMPRSIKVDVRTSKDQKPRWVPLILLVNLFNETE